MIKHSGCVSRDRHIVCFHVQECMCIDIRRKQILPKARQSLFAIEPTDITRSKSLYIRNENERSILL